MADRIVLHAGFHKSGTTALQYAFHKNRSSLRQSGVVYPPSYGHAHHRAAWGLIERVWGWKDNGGKLVPAKSWQTLARQVKKNSGIALISSEFFAEAKDHHVAQAKQDFGSVPVTIVFTLRPFAKILASSYQQFLKFGVKVRFNEWLEHVFSKKYESTITPTFWNRVQVDEIVGRWGKFFGSENVIVILADESKPEFIFQEFTKILGISSDALPLPEVGGNRSMTLEETELLLQINNIYDQRGGWEQYQALIREGYVRHLSDHTKADPDAERILTPEWAVKEARNINHRQFQRLQEMNIEIRGDLEGFVDAPVLTGNNAVPERISIRLAAEFLASYKYSLLRRIRVRVLIQELRRRFRVTRKRLRRGVR
ncbi:MAG: hypothetical protein ACKOFU_00080 [Actinomycetota bacterium]